MLKLTHNIRSIILPFLILSFLTVSEEKAFTAPVSSSSKADQSPLSNTGQKKLNSEIERRIKEGKRYYNLKKYNLAIYEWQLALSLDPSNAKIKKYIDDANAKLQKTLRMPLDLISVVMPFKEGSKVFSLKECIDTAIKNNISLQIAKKSAELADMRVWEARRNMFPKISLSWEESYGKIYARRYYSKKEYVEGSHTLFKGGELFFILKQAEINVEVAKHEYNKTKNELILQVKKAYYSLAKAKENLRMQEDLEKTVRAITDMVNKEFDAGVASRLELLNVTSQDSQVKFQLASAQGDADVARLILKQTMNLDLDEPLDIEPRLEFKKVELDFNKFLNMALVNRPEMRINSLTLQYYEYEKRVARAKNYPKVDVMGSWGQTKDEYMSIDNQRAVEANGNVHGDDPDRKLEAQWYAGAKVSMPFWGSTGEYSFTQEKWPPVVSAYHGTEARTNTIKLNLLDKLGNFSEKISADMDYDRARQELNKGTQDVTLEVKEGCFNCEKAIIQFETAENKVKYQERDLELIKYKRALDEAPDSTVIESMIKTAQEKFGYAQALADYHIAIASLNKAIGIDDYINVEERVNR